MNTDILPSRKQTSAMGAAQWIALLWLTLGAVAAGAAQAPFVAIHTPSSPVTIETLAQATSWGRLDPAAGGRELKPNAVLINDHLALAGRVGDASADLFSNGSGAWKLRAKIAPLDFAGARISKLRVRVSGEDLASLEMEFAGAGKTAVIHFDLRPAQMFVRSSTVARATGLQVQAVSRYGVVPDFFADDVTMDARTVPIEQIAFPTDDVFLQPGVGGDALLGYFWSGNQEIECRLEGQGDERRFSAVSVRYSGDKPFIALAVLDASNAGYVGDYESLTRGEFKYEYDKWNQEKNRMEKVPASAAMVEMHWGMPYFAQWRVDFLVRRDTGDNDVRTRQMLLPEGNGKWRFAKLEQGIDHRQHEQVVVRAVPGKYPAWFQDDTARTGRVSPLRENYAVVVYPFDRGRETPLEAVTFMDLFREIIGKGPCEYILASQANTDEGLAACPATERIQSYEGHIREKRAEIEELLRRLDKFLHVCHSRLVKYKQCKEESRSLLNAYANQAPQQATPVVNKLRPIIERIPEPSRPIEELEAEWNPLFAAYRATLDSDGPEAKQQRAELGEKLRHIGGRMEGVYFSGARKHLKQLRTQAGVEGALHPDFLVTATRIRGLVTETLKGPTAHEQMHPDLR